MAEIFDYLAEQIKQLKHPFRRKDREIDDAVVRVLEAMRLILQQHENLLIRDCEVENDPRYMLSQIERLTWEGHQLRRALIVSGANMDEVKEMTNNEAWMAAKKGAPDG